jgi:hypothetical protein
VTASNRVAPTAALRKAAAEKQAGKAPALAAGQLAKDNNETDWSEILTAASFQVTSNAAVLDDDLVAKSSSVSDKIFADFLRWTLKIIYT